MTRAHDAAHDAAACQRFFDALSEVGTVLCVKLYRLQYEPDPPVPVLPCLDHEAMLHEGITPHAAAYVQDRGPGHLHELVFVPAAGRIEIDPLSTWGECTLESRQRFADALRARFPEATVRMTAPAWFRGEPRVAKACRAHVSLRDVLSGEDLTETKAAVDRLQTVGTLMEKQSRVASWGSRTVMTPLLALAGFLCYQILGGLQPWMGGGAVELLRYAVVGLIGAFFLYYGLKAVQLTGMANRVWKRSAEYALILAERQRLGQRSGK